MMIVLFIIIGGIIGLYFALRDDKKKKDREQLKREIIEELEKRKENE